MESIHPDVPSQYPRHATVARRQGLHQAQMQMSPTMSQTPTWDSGVETVMRERMESTFLQTR
jgi:hypothetical protein